MAYAQGLDGIQMRGTNDLALNYSKEQLAHLVQIGQLDPLKAMLAGMAIDRVQTNAQKPPTATVFDDVLGQQAQQPQDMSGIASMAPQQGQQPQPEQMPQEGAGVSALPSGIEGMADGGIVGYAGGGVPPNDPSWQISKDKQRLSDRQKYDILQFELDAEEAKATQGDQRAAQNAIMIRREMQRVWKGMEQPPSAKPAAAGVQQLPPIAGAQPKATPAVNSQPAEEAVYDPMTGVQISGPAPTPARREVKPGEKYTPSLVEDFLSGPVTVAGTSNNAPATSKPAAPAATTTAPAGVAPAPKYIDARTQPEGQAAPASPYNLPALSDPRYKVDVPTEAAPVPKVRSVKEAIAEKTEAEKDAGVDTEVYSKMIQSIGKKREDLAGRKGEAIGEAIMMAGLKLMGARKGQEFKALSEGAQEGLKQYAASMKEVKATQDKYDERMEAYRLSENEAKRTGVTSALNTVEKDRERLQAAEAENRKAKNRAAEVAATLGAGLKEADIRAMSALFGTQARAGLTREEAMKMAMKSLADRGKINPTPAEVQAEMSKITSVYSGDAATPAAPTSVDYANKYGIAPTR
jgi:hypothetical protein